MWHGIGVSCDGGLAAVVVMAARVAAATNSSRTVETAAGHVGWRGKGGEALVGTGREGERQGEAGM